VKRSTKIQIAIIAGVLLIAAGIIAIVAINQPRFDTETRAQTPVVAENSHRLALEAQNSSPMAPEYLEQGKRMSRSTFSKT
jgi:hypothetical protein